MRKARKLSVSVSQAVRLNSHIIVTSAELWGGKKTPRPTIFIGSRAQGWSKQSVLPNREITTTIMEVKKAVGS